MKRIEFSVQYMGNTDFNCVGSINVLLTLGYTRDNTEVYNVQQHGRWGNKHRCDNTPLYWYVHKQFNILNHVN